MNFSFRVKWPCVRVADRSVNVGHCQGRMFNIKSGVGTLKWSAPPETPFIPGPGGGGRNRCTRYLLSKVRPPLSLKMLQLGLQTRVMNNCYVFVTKKTSGRKRPVPLIVRVP